MIELSDIFEKSKYQFKDQSLAVRALTHSSFDPHNNYERLEFLGDSIVGYAVSDILFHGEEKDEGAMTKKRASMVSKEPLAYLSDQLGLSAFCRRRNCALSLKMKCDLYEAYTAAIALDGGFESAVEFVKRTIRFAPYATDDYKSKLKEYCEKNKLDYRATHTSSGKDNKKFFTVEIYVGVILCGVGQGSSIHFAENQACKVALRYFNLI